MINLSHPITRQTLSCLVKKSILLPILLVAASTVSAQDFNAGVLDEPVSEITKGSARGNNGNGNDNRNGNGSDNRNGNGNGNNGIGQLVRTQQELIKEVRKEQQALEKESRAQLKNRADDGERLAQVALANEFAAEAQLLTFAPAAANDALSDALRLYSLAAQRGFPGAAALDSNGVSFQAVRVIRNN